MNKEMVVSASPQETKIAILEDGQVVEVYFERAEEYSLAGSIYKGRVTRILPGMQSAFVNIGLERDAFLYVSDFLEQVEEYDRVSTAGEAREVSRPAVREEAEEETPSMEATEGGAPPEAPSPAALEQPRGSEAVTEAAPFREAPAEPRERPRRFSRRSRRHRGRHRGLPESKYARSGAPPAEEWKSTQPSGTAVAPVLLPGESFAKYKDLTSHSSESESVAEEQPPVTSSEIDRVEQAEPGPGAEASSGQPAAPQPAFEPEPSTAAAESFAEAPPLAEPERGGAVREGQPASVPPEAAGSVALPGESRASEAEGNRAGFVAEADEAGETSVAGSAGPGLEEAPSWEALEERVLDVIDDAEPDSPESGLPPASTSP
ncbi:MAG TPA: hypothetical protein VNN17_12840, partial [Terriglobia bacterium]|nr:hypothetical protein [Terriglobia bacterium]